MKQVTVQYPDIVDISTIVKGADATVNFVVGGIVFAITDMIDEVSIPIDHYHSLDAPGANTGPAIIP